MPTLRRSHAAKYYIKQDDHKFTCIFWCVGVCRHMDSMSSLRVHIGDLIREYANRNRNKFDHTLQSLNSTSASKGILNQSRKKVSAQLGNT